MPPFPPLYPILDVDCARRRGHDLAACAADFARLGLEVQQLRAKNLEDREFLRLAERLARAVPRLIVNDRADIALLAGAAGLHLGQDDMPIAAARKLREEWLIGLSTHRLEQAAAAAAEQPGYLAIGPVFPTISKAQPDPLVGVQTVAAVRRQYSGTLVAIGGIQPGNCAAVWAAGADAVAVISALWDAERPAAAAERLLAAHAASCASRRILP